MILWPCFSCGSTAYCEHREHDAVIFAIATNPGAEVIPDPLPPQPDPRQWIPIRKPPVRALYSVRGPAVRIRYGGAR